MSARTIVVSDLHGRSDLLTRALDHACFTTGDRLVVAGDLIDVGTDDTIALAQSLGATILAGNHEVSAAIGLRISPQNPESIARGSEFAGCFATGEWPLAVAVDGWLITHAGVSVSFDDVLLRAGFDPVATADALNDLFRDEITRAVRSMPLAFEDLGRFRILGGEMGPLWFRPMNPELLPSGLRQVVGHTPPDALGARLSAVESRGWRLVEPGGHGGPQTLARYAVIENGDATTFDVTA